MLGTTLDNVRQTGSPCEVSFCFSRIALLDVAGAPPLLSIDNIASVSAVKSASEVKQKQDTQMKSHGHICLVLACLLCIQRVLIVLISYGSTALDTDL